MKLIPFGSYVISQKERQKENKTSSGIILNTKQDTPVYEVCEVGKSCTEAKPNDRIIVRNGSGTEMIVDGKTIYCFQERTDLIAKIEGDEPESH
jgi:co-chaperonin GroES (HSP10)